MSSSSKSILITGCSSGIGYDAAHRLHDLGWQVLATCRQEADCERLQREGLQSFVLDYEDPASVATAVEETLSRTGGRLDALFNNGAYALPGPLEDITREALTAQFQANVLGWHDLTQRLIPVMRAQGHGRIVNNTSVLGFISPPFRGPYSATKYAVEALSDAMRVEMKGTGIYIILIEPGPIKTEFRTNAGRAFDRWVDWKASARREEYEASLLDQLYFGSTGSRFTLPASAVTEKLITALEARRPRARYFVTQPTYYVDLLRRILPTPVKDMILARF